MTMENIAVDFVIQEKLSTAHGKKNRAAALAATARFIWLPVSWVKKLTGADSIHSENLHWPGTWQMYLPGSKSAFL